jgi:hypothetical protein
LTGIEDEREMEDEKVKSEKSKTGTMLSPV